MSDLEKTASTGERTGRPEPTEWRRNTEVRDSSLEGREVSELPTNHLGDKDAPLRDFRMKYENEYLEPMSRTKPIEAFADPKETVARVNPQFDDTKRESYEVNCADSSRAFERTWRGQQEEAAGRAETPDSEGKMGFRGESPKRMEDWAGESYTKVDDIAAVKARLEEGGHGTSAIVRCNWEIDLPGGKQATGAHAYNVVNHEGQLQVVDAQRNEVKAFDDKTIYPGMDRVRDVRVMMWDETGKRVF